MCESSDILKQQYFITAWNAKDKFTKSAEKLTTDVSQILIPN